MIWLSGAKRAPEDLEKAAAAIYSGGFWRIAAKLFPLYLAQMVKFCIFLGVAGAVAVALGTITHNELGLSPTFVRDAALLCSGVLGIGLYSDRFGGRK
jgi:hypothetical protein